MDHIRIGDVHLSRELFAALEDYRRKQPIIGSRVSAIRHLLKLGLAVEAERAATP